MDIAFGIDDNFVMPCGVFMLSILKTNREAKICFHILSESISGKNKELLGQTVQGYNCEIKYYQIERAKILSALPSHYPVAIYYRLFMPVLLPDSLTKALYFDADMLCVDSILELWETDITNYAVAVSVNQHSDRIDLVNRIGWNIQDGHMYFNSGMLLINLDYWRKNDIAGKAMKFMQEHPEKCIFPDQDALNYATLGCRKMVSFRFNCGSVSRKAESMMVRKEYHNDIEESQKNPAVIHFIASRKPWHVESSHPYKEVWRFVKKQTPWKYCRLKFAHKNKIISTAYMLEPMLLKLLGRSFFERFRLVSPSNNIDFTQTAKKMYIRLGETAVRSNIAWFSPPPLYYEFAPRCLNSFLKDKFAQNPTPYPSVVSFAAFYAVRPRFTAQRALCR